MKLSVIMPVYNEERTVREIIARVRAVPVAKEVLVVDDGSTDGTAAILDGLGLPDVRVFHLPDNRGKGAAVRHAIERVTGDCVIIQDADLEYDPEDYPRLLAAREEAGARVIYGNRLHSGNTRHSYLRYLLGGMTVTLATNILYGARLHDEPTCYKLFEADLLRSLRLECEGFEFCPEVTAKLLRLGVKIEETPIHYHPRGFAEGKKIGWRDGVRALWTLLRVRFMRRAALLRAP